jgi:hypothetical protein
MTNLATETPIVPGPHRWRLISLLGAVGLAIVFAILASLPVEQCKTGSREFFADLTSPDLNAPPATCRKITRGRFIAENAADALLAFFLNPASKAPVL